MTFSEAMRDHSILAIRKPEWNQKAKLALPPVTNEQRGAWCKLYDPVASPNQTFDIMIFELSGDNSLDWEPTEL